MVVHVVGGPDGGAVVASGGHYVYVLEAGFAQNAAIHNAVQTHTAGDHQMLGAGFLLQHPTHFECAIFHHALRRGRHVFVVFLYGSVGTLLANVIYLALAQALVFRVLKSEVSPINIIFALIYHADHFRHGFGKHAGITNRRHADGFTLVVIGP